MTRIGVLGCGRIGQVHANTIAQMRGVTLAAVSDANPEAAQALAAELGTEVRATDAILSATDIDAIVICTPTDTHADLIEAGVRAGKAVFCEKPIDLDPKRVRACLDIVAAENGVLMIGFQRRFDPHFRALKDAIVAGDIGTVEHVHVTSRDPGPPPLDYVRRSGGLFRDMTIHDFDMARFLLDEAIVRVFASGSICVSPEIADVPDIDTATVIMETERGAQVVITNSRRATYGYDQRVEVLGSKGMLQVANMPATQMSVSTESGVSGAPLLDFFMSRYAGAYAEELRAFVDVIEKKSDVPVTGHDGLAALLLAEAAVRSLKEGSWVAV